MNEGILGKYFHRRLSKKLLWLYFLSLPLIAGISWLVVSSDLAATADNPGGCYFEIAFWMTALGTALLSFVMMEVLFRSRETKILAPWPVRPEKLFWYQMKRVFSGILFSLIPYTAFWAFHIYDAPVVSLLSILMWPFGLCICASISAAVLLYTGEAGTQTQKNRASFGATAFSMAPAVALAISLMITLLLKLLAEALLKPGFVDAAMTAVGITSVVFVVALIYAAHLYKRRYYAILASFLDTDMIQLNANYEFIDGNYAEKLRQSKTLDALIADCYMLMFDRRHPVSMILVITFAVIMALVLWNNPDYLSSPFVVLLAVMPWMAFSRPWASFHTREFNTGLLEAMPVTHQCISRARMRACFEILLRHGGFLVIAIAIPCLYHFGWGRTLIYVVSVIVLCSIATIAGSLICHRMKRGQ